MMHAGFLKEEMSVLGGRERGPFPTLEMTSLSLAWSFRMCSAYRREFIKDIPRGSICGYAKDRSLDLFGKC